jgi:fatty-acyl-CoA synthase
MIGVEQLSYEPLTPTSFLRRSALVFGDRTAVIDGVLRLTYAELLQRAERLAGGLQAFGVEQGARVAVLAPNTHVMLEAHYGVPLAGAVLVALNFRLTPAELAYITDHAGARLLLHDHSLAAQAKELATLARPGLRLIEAGGEPDEYERLLEGAEPRSVRVEDERTLISLNYTSGTTGRPKGVMYHHRGACLQALAMAYHARLEPRSVYLWTLPMFHCNGWCFTWAVSAAGAVHLCLPRVDPAEIWRLIESEGVTHLCAAPTVLISLAHHPAARPVPRPVRVATGGAPPSPALLERMAELGIEITHLYGLTETFGPAVVCDWHPEWDALPAADQARLKARQGVGNVISKSLRVLGPDGRDVPANGLTMGEIALRGNNLMLGYYRDDEATVRAAPDGWFRTGDLGVVHPDGYVELRDRAKDIIVSGGENIASVEVEQAIASHPAVLEVAVIPAPDPKWGEVPAAYVTLKQGARVTEAEIVAHARDRLAHFKAPKRVVFGPLPKTSTGKIQKYVLREQAWAGQERRVR